MNNDKNTLQFSLLADLFKVFGDTTRVKILYALLDGELCVSEISNRLSMTQSAASHQLSVLKSSKLVDRRRECKEIYCFLANNHVSTTRNLMVTKASNASPISRRQTVDKAV